MQTIISKSERRYLEDGILQGIRLDGRGCLEFRPYNIETGILPSANGSARVFTYDADVVACVKCEAGKVDENNPDEGDIRITIDCQVTHTNEDDTKSQENLGYQLSDIYTSLCLSNAIIDRKKLIILEGSVCWVIYVDVTVLKGCDIGLLDLISVCVRAALSDTILPSVSGYEIKGEDELTHTHEYQLQANDRESAGIRFPIQCLPICLSVGQIRDRFVWDMCAEEIVCADVIMTAAIDYTGKCIGLHKSGRGVISNSAFNSIIQNCQSIGIHFIQKLEDTLNELYTHRFDGFERMGFIRF